MARPADTRQFNLNLKTADEAWLRRLSERTGQPVGPLLVETAYARYRELFQPEALLIDNLTPDVRSFTVDVKPDYVDNGLPEVQVTAVEPGPTEIGGAKLTPDPENFAKRVDAEARTAAPGQVAIELVAREPQVEWAGARVLVCVLPTGVAATIKVDLVDLNPRLKPEAE
jgi:hypothetical protein